MCKHSRHAILHTSGRYAAVLVLLSHFGYLVRNTGVMSNRRFPLLALAYIPGAHQAEAAIWLTVTHRAALSGDGSGKEGEGREGRIGVPRAALCRIYYMTVSRGARADAYIADEARCVTVLALFAIFLLCFNHLHLCRIVFMVSNH